MRDLVIAVLILLIALTGCISNEKRLEDVKNKNPELRIHHDPKRPYLYVTNDSINERFIIYESYRDMFLETNAIYFPYDSINK